MRVAFVTCAGLSGGYADDREAARLLGADHRAWDDERVDWDRYDRVVIRSTWNYTSHLDEFLAWSDRVGPARLRNVPALVRFNVDKRYLTKLRAPTVPTLLVEPGTSLPSLDGEVVVKPNVSAGARDTGRFGPGAHQLAEALIHEIHASGRAALIQPYLPAVDSQGELALVFFAGELSHTLHKRAILDRDEVAPATGGELGVAEAMLREDLVTLARCGERELRFAREVLAEIAERFGGMPLYARVDIVSDGARLLLLELEAVEPTLYLALAPGASERFARAVLAS